jgi:hypothetical protein
MPASAPAHRALSAPGVTNPESQPSTSQIRREVSLPQEFFRLQAIEIMTAVPLFDLSSRSGTSPTSPDSWPDEQVGGILLRVVH